MKGWALGRGEYGDKVVYKLSVIDVKTTLSFTPNLPHEEFSSLNSATLKTTLIFDILLSGVGSFKYSVTLSLV
jgi:hypothetical protein